MSTIEGRVLIVQVKQYFQMLRGYQGLNTIVHVGAHMGQELDAYIHLGFRKIVFIEADPILAGNLSSIVIHSGYSSKVLVINSLIGEYDGLIRDFHVYNNNRGSSSVYQPTDQMGRLYPGLKPTGEKFSLTTRRLDSLLYENNVFPQEVSSIVYDIQGSEYSAIIGTGQFLAKPFLIEVECSTLPIYGGAPAFSDVHTLLKNLGYKLATKPVPEHGDVVFLNKRHLIQ